MKKEPYLVPVIRLYLFENLIRHLFEFSAGFH